MARSDVSLLNFVVSDGRTLIATRYASNADEAPASLYYAEVGRVSWGRSGRRWGDGGPQAGGDGR